MSIVGLQVHRLFELQELYSSTVLTRVFSTVQIMTDWRIISDFLFTVPNKTFTLAHLNYTESHTQKLKSTLEVVLKAPYGDVVDSSYLLSDSEHV